MTDIALADVQVIWDREGAASREQVRVVGGAVKDDNSYSSSWGSCDADFNEADESGKLRMLLAQSIFLTYMEGIPPKTVHDAFMVIPEYRAAMTSAGVIVPEDEAEY